MQAKTPEVQPDDSHLPRRERRYPYRALTPEEAVEVRREINDILISINDLMFQIARRVMPSKARKPDLEECVQAIRLRLATYSIARYDTQHVPHTRLTTFLHKCATMEAVIQRRQWLRQRRATPYQILDESVPAPDTSRDRAVEALAERIVNDPSSIGLTRAETRAVRAVIDAPPETERKRVSELLGYASPTTLSNTLRRAADRIIDLDIFAPADAPESSM